jgi:hypothetical protein
MSWRSQNKNSGEAWTPLSARRPAGGVDRLPRQHGPTAAGSWAASQPVAWTALRMTGVTTPGSEIIDRCGAFTSVMGRAHGGP